MKALRLEMSSLFARVAHSFSSRTLLTRVFSSSTSGTFGSTRSSGAEVQLWPSSIFLGLSPFESSDQVFLSVDMLHFRIWNRLFLDHALLTTDSLCRALLLASSKVSLASICKLSDKALSLIPTTILSRIIVSLNSP